MTNQQAKPTFWHGWIPDTGGWQRKILWHAISHFGIIDTSALDPKQLDITWGKRSEIVLRDVGLHVNVGSLSDK